MRGQKTIQMAEIALMSAVLCVLAPIALPLPVSPVPLTLATFAVYLAAALLGPKKGTLCVLVYLLLGMAGLPVFSGFSGGIGTLLGPTGGYLIGYIPCAVVIGLLAEQGVGKLFLKQWQQVFWNLLAMVFGTLVCYTFGMVWFLIIMEDTYTLTQAILICVVPYLLFDAVKVFTAAALAVPIRKILRRIDLR